MPAKGKRWRHVILSTRSSWFHGDERGFRSRRHRIHSSGDYKHPPPADEHADLLIYRLGKSGIEVRLAEEIRPLIGNALRQHLEDEGHRVLAVAVTKVHAHVLVELPDFITSVKKIVGDAKRVSSRAVKKQLPGAVWARGGNYKPIDSRSHQINTLNYILFDQGLDAWTWSFQDGSNAGQFGRARAR